MKMINEKEYNDFKNANLVRDGLPEGVSPLEVIQKLQQKVEDLEEKNKTLISRNNLLE